MTRDELLDELGRLARAQSEQPAPGEPDTDELLRPLDAAAHDRIVARLLPLVRAESSPAHAVGVAAPQAVSRRPWSRRWVMIIAPLFAAAAALLVWFARPKAVAPLPMYALELGGGMSAERGADAKEVIRVGRGDVVSVVLRPARAVSGAVAVRVFIDGRGLMDAPTYVVEQSADGAVRISDLGPPLAALGPGRHRLQFAVGRPGSLPNALPDAPSASVVADGVQLLEIEYEYEIERLPP